MKTGGTVEFPHGRRDSGHGLPVARQGSGVAAFDGNFSLDQPGGSASLSAFAVAAVAGSSWHQAFKWLDSKGNIVLYDSDARNSAPIFTSADRTHLEVGETKPYPVQASGSPEPTLTV